MAMTTTPTTVAGLKKLTAPKLKDIAGEIFDADELKGARKQELVEMLADYYAREKVQDQLADASDELDDDELDDDEVDSPDELDDDEVEDMTLDELADTVEKVQAEEKVAPPEPTGDTLTAKQVATRIGTDAKTLRKFFRSPNSTVEAVGQGGRYEFAKEDLEKIRSEFTNWSSNKPARAPKGSKSTADAEPKRKVEDIPEEDLEFDDEELEASADEVEDDELEDDELDDDELDLELDDEDE
jgi:hypothetical protein